MEHKFTLDMPGKVRDETNSRVVRYVLFTCLLRKVTSQPKRNDTKIIFLTGSTNIFGHFLQWAAGNIELMGSLMQVMDLSRLPPQ